MTTTIQLSPKRGQVLPNGAVIIDYKRADGVDKWIALCLWTEDKTLGNGIVMPRHHDPYVTWVVFKDEQRWTSLTGNYHEQLSEALDNFNARS